MKAVLLVVLVPLCAGMLCPPNKYWSTKVEDCVDCSRCKQNQVTVTPCQTYQNAECRTIAEMKFDWPFVPKEETHHLEKERLHVIDDGPETPKKNHHFHHIKASDDTQKEAPDHQQELDIKADKHKMDSKHHHKKKVRNRLEETAEVDDRRRKPANGPVNRHKGEEDKARPANKHKQHFEFDSEEYYDDDDYSEETFGRVPDRSTKKHDVFPAHVWKEAGKNQGKKRTQFPRIRDEKELRRWLVQSQNKLKHRKDDLMKNLKEEHLLSRTSDEDTRVKLNHPIYKLDAKLIQDLLNHESHSNKTKNHQKNFSELDLNIFKELVDEEKTKDSELINLITKSSNKLPLDYKSVVPTHRMFLGEPSTVSEIIGQVKDPQEVIKEEFGKDIVIERSSKFGVVPLVDDHEDVVSVPFSTAEKFVSDWQAVAFVSAIVSCLLFFVVAIVYTILNARQWRRVKIQYEVDPDEMSSKLALMQTSLEGSAGDGASTGRYLEHLIALHKLEDRKSNEYTNDAQS